MMNILYKIIDILCKIIMVIGIVLIISAAGNDELYGTAYPTSKIAIYLITGLTCLIVGYQLKNFIKKE